MTNNEPFYDYNDAYKSSLKYFNGNDLAASVFLKKYALHNNEGKLVEKTPDDMHWRLATEFARVEKQKYEGTKIKPYSAEEIYNKFKNFSQIIPQGSPMFAIGNNYQVASAGNCFVVASPIDSYGGILSADQNMVQLCKRRAGVGVDISNLRPAGTPTNNAAKSSTGIIPFCERFSNSIREVASNNRRGAQMQTCDIRHPESVKLYTEIGKGEKYVIPGAIVNGVKQRDIETTTEFYNPDDLDFCTMKMDSSKVTGANVSIKLTDEFLECVRDNKPFIQRWPIECSPEEAKITKVIDARRAWDKIVHCAWQRAEPGLLFWDTILRESPADCYSDYGFRSLSTNPCGEIVLNEDSCRLLVINLMSVVDNPYTENAEINFDKLKENAYFAQRLMDDLVDLELEIMDKIISKINLDPEPDYIKENELRMWIKFRSNCKKGRRTGTGIVALGDAVAASNVRYGTDASIDLIERIYEQIKLSTYRASVDMAEAIGSFECYNPDLEINNPFINRIKEADPSLYDDMVKHGRRNIALLTTAPTGTVALLAQVIPGIHGTTGGIEPNYSNIPYVRKRKINPGEQDAKVDSVDQNGDKWTHYDVYPAGIEAWKQVTGETDIKKSPYHKASAEELDWTKRVELQAKANKHVDHSISSTVNLPNDVSEETVKSIYDTAWNLGVKGITVYRDGCRSGVLVKKSDTDNLIYLNTKSAPKRPKQLDADIHLITAKGNKYVIAIGLLEGQPYEIFGGQANGFGIRHKCTGVLTKHKRGQYGLNIGAIEIDDFSKHFTPEEQTIFRLASTHMRHGLPIEFLVEQMQKSTDDMFSLPSAVARVLKKYIKDGQPVNGQVCPECGSTNLVYENGCVVCRDCGWTACN